MNRKRKIVVVSAISIIVLGLTTGWGVLTDDAWPPEPYQAYSVAGAWTEKAESDPPEDISIMMFSPEDPRTGTGTLVAKEITKDPTWGGYFSDATSMMDWLGTYVRTGPNTYRCKGVYYVRKDEEYISKILNILVMEGTVTQTSPDTIEGVSTFLIYSPDSDKDDDGLPDADEQPLSSFPITQHMKRI